MRFHVVALPHTHLTPEFSSCAYTMKVIGFCRMMKKRGHQVFLYAGEKNTAPCDEHVVCIDEVARMTAVGYKHYTEASFDPNSSHWKRFNESAIYEIGKRKQPKDFICVIGGWAHKPIADAFPDLMTVEFGVGYGGTFSKYRVFESYAWMHTCYGAASMGQPHAIDGNWWDEVIPGYLDPNDFPYRGTHRRGNDYALYVGRMIDRKGYDIAMEVCQKVGKRLVLAGPGLSSLGGYGEYVGVVGPEERGRLMAGATALFVPTKYIEPFGNVAIEAMACGTPVITTDWGAFTETVIDGVTGFRCRNFEEFINALAQASKLDHRKIRRHVAQNYALDVIGAKYESYFERLLTLWDKGWYQLEA